MPSDSQVRRPGAVLPALAFALIPAIAAAQAGRLSGTVKNADGKPMRGVTVVASNPDAAPHFRSAVTDDKGQYTIVALRGGVWVVTTAAEGYLPSSTAARVSLVSPTTRVNLTLRPDPDYRAPATEGIDANEVQSRIAEADALEAQARHAEAIQAYEAILARLPALTSLHLQIGRAHHRAGEHTRAADAFGRALSGGIAREVVLPELALLRLDEGNTAGAKAALEQLRGDEARAGAALYVRALVAAREGDRATARALLEEFLSLEPDAPEAAAARKLLEELAHPSQP